MQSQLLKVMDGMSKEYQSKLADAKDTAREEARQSILDQRYQAEQNRQLQWHNDQVTHQNEVYQHTLDTEKEAKAQQDAYNTLYAKVNNTPNMFDTKAATDNADYMNTLQNEFKASHNGLSVDDFRSSTGSSKTAAAGLADWDVLQKKYDNFAGNELQRASALRAEEMAKLTPAQQINVRNVLRTQAMSKATKFAADGDLVNAKKWGAYGGGGAEDMTLLDTKYKTGKMDMVVGALTTNITKDMPFKKQKSAIISTIDKYYPDMSNTDRELLIKKYYDAGIAQAAARTKATMDKAKLDNISIRTEVLGRKKFSKGSIYSTITKSALSKAYDDKYLLNSDNAATALAKMTPAQVAVLNSLTPDEATRLDAMMHDGNPGSIGDWTADGIAGLANSIIKARKQ